MIQVPTMMSLSASFQIKKILWGMCPSVSYADSPEVDVKIYNDLGKFYIVYSPFSFWR